MKCSVNFSRIKNKKIKKTAHKNMQVFSYDNVENKLCKASVFWMNDSRIHKNMKIARDDSAANLSCSDWCDFPLNASERISEQADVISEACFTVMTRDHHDEQAAMDFSMIIFALTLLWLVWILTVMPVWLYFSSFLFCSVLFLNTELYILYEC